MGNRWSKY